MDLGFLICTIETMIITYPTFWAVEDSVRVCKAWHTVSTQDLRARSEVPGGEGGRQKCLEDWPIMFSAYPFSALPWKPGGPRPLGRK